MDVKEKPYYNAFSRPDNEERAGIGGVLRGPTATAEELEDRGARVQTPVHEERKAEDKLTNKPCVLRAMERDEESGLPSLRISMSDEVRGPQDEAVGDR